MRCFGARTGKRKKRRGFLFAAGFMLLLPLLAGRASLPERSDSEAEPPVSSAAAYHVLCTETGTVLAVPVRDYLIGAVGAEMPADYPQEALKAQTVAAHTYAEYIRLQQKAHPDPALHGADFSDDSRQYQAFFTEQQLRDFYGSSFPQQYEKLAAAVDAAADELLCYQRKPIAAAFHAISAGRTDAAADIWGADLPYLVPVDSPADKTAPDYAVTVQIPAETVAKALQSAKPDAKFSGDAADWFTDTECAASGTVLRMQGGGVLWTGQEIRSALGLRSACFTVQAEDDVFSFTTKGYGHNAGMSQYGAACLAEQGKDYREILLNYYPQTEIVRQSAA